MTMDTIIFDIDGTLADVEHRRHFLSGAKPAWGAFFDEMVNDPPLRDVCLLAELLGDHPLVNQGAIKLFLFSGRPETHRKETEEWLLIHARSYFQKAEALLMRGEGDYRADTIVKKEMLRSIQAKGYVVRLVVDDRPSVVEMWKAEGLTVLAHDSGEWDGIHKTWAPGELHMMVGPAGAGKSTYIKKAALDPALDLLDEGYDWTIGIRMGVGAIISSDALREEISGSFLGMQDNNQVFSVMHAMTKARLEGGLKVVIDATNLRSRDRRALRDCAPTDAEIFYYVIDRPLAEKHRDAGWRDDVVLTQRDGTPIKLIDKMHQSFKSGIKAILAGDDDPRVTVYDHRRT
jgi:predicted kinase